MILFKTQTVALSIGSFPVPALWERGWRVGLFRKFGPLYLLHYTAPAVPRTKIAHVGIEACPVCDKRAVFYQPSERGHLRALICGHCGAEMEKCGDCQKFLFVGDPFHRLHCQARPDNCPCWGSE